MPYGLLVGKERISILFFAFQNFEKKQETLPIIAIKLFGNSVNCVWKLTI